MDTGSESRLCFPHALRPGLRCSASVSSHLSTLTRKLEYDGTYLLGFYEDRMQSWRQSPCACLAPDETHEEAATSILSEIKVQLFQLEGQGPPPLLPQEGSGGHSLETLDLDSRLAIRPKVALADDYRGQNSVRFVNMEFGHRILETEKPQKPKISMSEGTVLPQLPGPRVVWTYQERTDTCSDSRLGSRHLPIGFLLGIPEHPGRGALQLHNEPQGPPFPGIPCFPTSTRLKCLEGPAAPGHPSPT